MKDCIEHIMLNGRCTVCRVYDAQMSYPNYVSLASEFVQVKREDLEKLYSELKFSNEHIFKNVLGDLLDNFFEKYLKKGLK